MVQSSSLSSIISLPTSSNMNYLKELQVVMPAQILLVKPGTPDYPRRSGILLAHSFSLLMRILASWCGI